MKRILVFASGSKQGGGSGFEGLVISSMTNPPVLKAEVVGVVSNHSNGGVYERANALGVPFRYWPGPFTAEGYRQLVRDFQADFIMLSGWLKLVLGLDPSRTINIHNGPLEFSGPGMYGHHVHEAVMEAHSEGRIIQSAVVMQFVTEEYDRGPVFFRLPILILPKDTPETLAKRVNEMERAWQAYMLNLVIHRYIYLHDGSVHYMDNNPKKLF